MKVKKIMKTNEDYYSDFMNECFFEYYSDWNNMSLEEQNDIISDQFYEELEYFIDLKEFHLIQANIFYQFACRKFGVDSDGFYHEAY